MSFGARSVSNGFWKGVLTGLLLAGIVAFALAWVFPPARYVPPELPGDVVTAPSPPEKPPVGGLLTPPSGAPLIPRRPVAEMPPGLPGLSPPVAPEVFGTESGSPSLVPRDK